MQAISNLHLKQTPASKHRSAPPQKLYRRPVKAQAQSKSLELSIPGEAGVEQIAVTTTEGIISWLQSTYNLSDRRLVAPKILRAEQALKLIDESRTSLSLERDILPKLEVLEGLSPGLGWKVLARYPDEFIHPYATEYWGIMAAYLYTTGYPPDRIEKLFGRHICLFARTVQDPANLKALFDWLKSLGLGSSSITRLVDKHPLLLQTDLEGVIKPRIEYIHSNIGVPMSGIVSALHRMPELLGIDSQVIQECVEYLLNDVGLQPAQVAKLFVSQPAVFACSVDLKLKPVVTLLNEELGCQGPLLLKMVAQSGLLSRSLDTIRSRAAYWRDTIGFGSEGLLLALFKFPRLLLYPMEDAKYQLKIQFLAQVLLSSSEAEQELEETSSSCSSNTTDVASMLLKYPQYVTYSLDRRIAPRAAAVKHFVGSDSTLPLHKLAVSDSAFCTAYGIEEEHYRQFLVQWLKTEEAAKWLL